MFKYPIYKQDDEISCGAYCIKMLLKYYKQDVEITDIKERCRLTRTGITVYGIVKCLESFNIDAKAYESNFDSLLNEAKLPMIVLTKNEDLMHYMIVYKIIKDRIIVGDPEKGFRIMYLDEVEIIYQGILISVEHVGRPIKDITYFHFRDFLISYLKENYIYIIKLFIYSIFISSLSIGCSFFFELLIDKYKSNTFMELFIIIVIFLVMFLIKNFINFSKQNFIIHIKEYLDDSYIIKTIKDSIYLPLNYYETNSSGEFIARSDNLMVLSDFFIDFYQVIIFDSVFILMILIVMSILMPALIGVNVFFVLVISALMLLFGRKINNLNKDIINKKEHLNNHLNEMYYNAYNNRQYVLNKFIKNKIHYAYYMYLQLTYNKDRQMNYLNTIIDSLLQLMLMTSITIMVYITKKESMSLGLVILSYMMLSYMFEPIAKLVNIIVIKDEVAIIFDRYKQLISKKNSNKKRVGKIKKISFNHLSYSYGYGKPILEDIDFEIMRNTVIKGEVGSGKTTLLKLIVKYDNLLSGQIKLNDRDIKDINNNVIYSKITYLDKNPKFYHESLKFNMLLDRYDKKKMNYLLDYFELSDLKEYLEVNLNDDGGFLSSGQCQLVMLIRALLKGSDVLILDEALSNVDKYRFELVMDYLSDLKETIIIMVSHQINLVNHNFDCVIIDSGLVKKE